MSDLLEILKLTEDKKTVGEELRELLRKDFVLGMTKWVCRYGTLGEGHEKEFSVGLIYPQACREAYSRAYEASRQGAMAKKAQARLMAAEHKRFVATNDFEALDAEADMELATIDLKQALDGAKDLVAQLDEFNAIRKELEPKFRELYPEGIEQAEKDNWETITKYKIFTGQDTKAMPLSLERKAELGVEYNIPGMMAGLAIKNMELAMELKQQLEDKTNV